ncbi:DUF3885 domain-containing protein [Aurantiacibacter xanthus]|uniref:DUF3885 domain-containing protein n=1 Tax=Aurantiacibacter xanthus TaxID=1784712 RepID=A0A3A1P5L4_9SPHN|nr:DUF3885 domain-containing protein [Aurantiacibacter xanthus]RIV86090.1 DUF3885 domain-containing protein [Aurantiacibacter xanthus]
MSDFLARLEATFGNCLPEALFYNFDFSLRFELSQRGDWPTRILQACSRARTILDSLPTADDEWEVVLASYGEDFASSLAGFAPELLNIYGCEKEGLRVLGEIYVDGEFQRSLVTLDPPPSTSACLLAAVAADCPALVSPFPASPYLIDWQREVIVWPYDDRGMDVVATSRATLQPIYDRFRQWLLESDLARMDSTFA